MFQIKLMSKIGAAHLNRLFSHISGQRCCMSSLKNQNTTNTAAPQKPVFVAMQLHWCFSLIKLVSFSRLLFFTQVWKLCALPSLFCLNEVELKLNFKPFQKL